ncbi:MAG: Hercynine oxygenase [Verrucomicrobiae bacterium]|nr:Hercynine oxygenase [Verrucomicrobiae bacterium]
MKRAILILAAVIVTGGGIFAYINYSNRYLWPSDPVSSLQDLPAADRSRWPKPTAWSNVTVEVETATPAGIVWTNITYFVNSRGMKFVRIEPGSFWQGLTERQAKRMFAYRKIGQPVTLTKPYYLAAYETTLAEFEEYDPSFKKRREPYQRGNGFTNHPVIGVKWQESQKFCRWLSEQDGRTYRLPTEAEWEYACKAGTTTILYWGDNSWDRHMCNVGGIREAQETYSEDGYRYSAPVGVYPANPWGLYDMVGNAWEWVNDWFDWFPNTPQIDPTGPPTGKMRVDKGSGWDTRTRDIKSCARDGNNPADLFEKRGFRVLCEVE